MRRLVSLAVAALIASALCAPSIAQSSKSVATGMAKSLADSVHDMAQRDVDAQREVEIARQVAAIQVAAAIARQNAAAAQADGRRKQAQGQISQEQQPHDAEMAKLQQAHPQWRTITSSAIFKSWLETVPVSQKRLCLDSWSSDIAAACIDLFFSAQFVAPR